MNMTDSWWTASALNTADTEEYRRRMTHWTVHTLNAIDTELTLNAKTLNPTDIWILDWTLPTLNNSRQTMNAIDCNPANTEDHWLCMLQLYPIDWTLKKLNWCYKLWTLLALNAIELSRRYRLMLNTVHWILLTHKQYWTDFTLNTTERANWSERYTQPYPYHKTFKIAPWHSTPHRNFRPPFHTIRSSSPHRSAPLHILQSIQATDIPHYTTCHSTSHLIINIYLL